MLPAANPLELVAFVVWAAKRNLIFIPLRTGF
jgi:hypothetical protein